VNIQDVTRSIYPTMDSNATKRMKYKTTKTGGIEESN
jgi:hypothetical protein